MVWLTQKGTAGSDRGKISSSRFAIRRDEADLVRQRLYWLDGRDRVLMEMIYIRGSTFRQIAQIMGVSESTVSRRVRKISDRLVRCLYAQCLRSRRSFKPLELEIIRSHTVLNMGVRQIAKKFNLSRYRVEHILYRAFRITSYTGNENRGGEYEFNTFETGHIDSQCQPHLSAESKNNAQGGSDHENARDGSIAPGGCRDAV